MRYFQVQKQVSHLVMFPWFFCFLTAPLTPPTGKSGLLDDTVSTESLWWNPVGSFISRNLLGFDILEGDILLPSDLTSDNLKNAIKTKKYLWEDGIIPYQLGDNFTEEEEHKIMDAIKILELKTCIKFKEKEEQKTYIKFQKSKMGCFAPVGRLPGNNGPLPVNLQSPECFKEIGIIEHELLHVIGLFHEQSRPDRDDFVTIHWCNIDPYHRSDFRKGKHSEMETFDLPYDFTSIMHYPRLAFSINGQPTITANDDPNMTLGQRKYPSDSDFLKVQKMYNCDDALF